MSYQGADEHSTKGEGFVMRESHYQTGDAGRETALERKDRLRSPEVIQRLVIESALLRRMNAIHKDLKSEVQSALSPGDSIKAKNMQALEIGSVSLSSPNNKAVCTDGAVLLAQAADKGLELVDRLPANDTPEAVAIIDYLLENAPHLLPAPTVSPSDMNDLATEVLEQWQATGKKPAGWEIKPASEPRMTVTAGRSKVAKAAIDHLLGEVQEILPPMEAIEQKKEEA